MARAALSLAEENLLPPSLGGRGILLRIQLPVRDAQLRCRRKVQNLLKLGHRVYLMTAIQNIGALLQRDDRIAVEIGGPLFEFGEILNGLQCPLGAEQPLNVDAAQRGSLDAMPELLRPDVAHQVGSPVGVAVGMAVKARHAAGRFRAAPVFGLVELLLRERSHQQPEPFDLFRVQNAVEDLVEILDGDELPLRDVAQIRPRR